MNERECDRNMCDATAIFRLRFDAYKEKPHWQTRACVAHALWWLTGRYGGTDLGRGIALPQ